MPVVRMSANLIGWMESPNSFPSTLALPVKVESVWRLLSFFSGEKSDSFTHAVLCAGESCPSWEIKMASAHTEVEIENMRLLNIHTATLVYLNESNQPAWQKRKEMDFLSTWKTTEKFSNLGSSDTMQVWTR